MCFPDGWRNVAVSIVAVERMNKTHVFSLVEDEDIYTPIPPPPEHPDANISATPTADAHGDQTAGVESDTTGMNDILAPTNNDNGMDIDAPGQTNNITTQVGDGSCTAVPNPTAPPSAPSLTNSSESETQPQHLQNSLAPEPDQSDETPQDANTVPAANPPSTIPTTPLPPPESHSSEIPRAVAAVNALQEPEGPSSEMGDFVMGAYQFMMKHLTFAGAIDAIHKWVTFEKLLGPPAKSTAKISLEMRPDEVAWWYRYGRRDFERIPPVDNANPLGPRSVAWYTDKQPAWRGKEWPLVKDDGLAKDDKWEKMMVSGSSGFVILLICMTWWGIGVRTVDEQRQIVEVLQDMAWVLDAMVKRAESSTTETTTTTTTKKQPKMKRRAAPHVDTPPSKRRYVQTLPHQSWLLTPRVQQCSLEVIASLDVLIVRFVRVLLQLNFLDIPIDSVGRRRNYRIPKIESARARS